MNLKHHSVAAGLILLFNGVISGCHKKHSSPKNSYQSSLRCSEGKVIVGNQCLESNEDCHSGSSLQEGNACQAINDKICSDKSKTLLSDHFCYASDTYLNKAGQPECPNQESGESCGKSHPIICKKGEVALDNKCQAILEWTLAKDVDWYLDKRIVGKSIKSRILGLNHAKPHYKLHLISEGEAHDLACGQVQIDASTGIIHGKTKGVPLDAGAEELYEGDLTCRYQLEATFEGNSYKRPKELTINLRECQDCHVITNFGAIAYSPYRDGQSPKEEALRATTEEERAGKTVISLEQLEEDLEQVVKLTPAIRVYHINEDYLRIAKKVGLKVHYGVYIGEDRSIVSDDIQAFIEHANKPEYYDVILSLFVANESTWLHQYTQVGTPDDNNHEDLVDLIIHVREETEHRYPVTTGDLIHNTGSPGFNESDYVTLARNADFLVDHIYGWWDNQGVDFSHPISPAVSHLIALFDAQKSKATKLGTTFLVGEFGWPTAGIRNAPAHVIGDEDRQAIYLNDVFAVFNDPELIQNRQELLKSVAFSVFDEMWKPGEIERSWGIYHSDGTPKKFARLIYPDIVFPERPPVPTQD